MAKGPLQTPEPWQQSLVLFQVCRVIQDLLCWGEQPHSNPLPEGWAAAYRKSIANAVDLAKSNFHEDEETVEFLRKAERLATDVVSAMASSFSISGKVAAEWPEGYAERFQRLVKVELRLRELQESFAAAERQNDRLRREKRGFTRWASEVLANLPLMNPRTLNPRQVANLRQWVGLFVRHSGRPDDDLSTAELNAVMELSRSLRPFVVRAAQAIGFGDWGRLFAADYQSRSDAWEEFAAATENPRRPAEAQTADSSPVAIAAPQDRSAAFTAADSRQPVVAYAKPIDPVPDQFCKDGRPCGPLEGNATELLRAITGRDTLKPVELLKRHSNGRLFVQQLATRKFAVYFQTQKEFNDAGQRLTQSRDSKGKKSP
jgi:hypothetical protein